MPVIATRYRLCLLAGALLAAACTGDDDTTDVTIAPDETTAPETTTTEAPTTTTEDPTVAVEQAFHDQWDAYLEIVGDPDPANPLIEATYTGGARDEILDAVSKLILEGRVIVRPEDSSKFQPRVGDVARVSDTEYLLVQCTIQGLVLKDAESGATIDDEVAEFNRQSTYVLEADTWKVSRTTRLPDTVTTCDAF